MRYLARMTTPALADRTIAAALAEWRLGVQEPPSGGKVGLERIRAYIDGIGGPGGAYDSDGDYEWCGAFAAYCLMAADVPGELLRQKSPPERGGLGSVYRADCLARVGGATRITAARDLERGDVMIVGRLGRSRGEHIALVEEPLTDSGLMTIEGNASGGLPDGRWAEGVVRRTRPAVPTSTVRGFIFGLRFQE